MINFVSFGDGAEVDESLVHNARDTDETSDTRHNALTLTRSEWIGVVRLRNSNDMVAMN